MKNLIFFSFVLFFTSVLFTACSNEDNPVGPDDNGDQIIIETPRYMKLSKIVLTRFPANKSNGDKWDYHVFSNSPTRRPDIYVELVKSGNDAYVYRSDIKEDALFDTAYDNYVFTKAANSSESDLPYEIPLNQTFDINVWDDDGLSADDSMGSVTITTASYYNDNNAMFVFKTLKSGDLTIEIEGTWIY